MNSNSESYHDIELVSDNPILLETDCNEIFIRLRADSDVSMNVSNSDLCLFSQSQSKIIKYESKVEIKNKLISVFFHIFLMSVFEIFFYFFFIVNIEKELFLDKLMTYNEQLYTNYNNNISPEQHAIISNLMYNLFNEKMLEDLKTNYEEDMKQQKILFNMLLNKSIILSTIVGSIFISSIIYGRKEVKINWVLFENILLFLFLGLYEYIFFNTIILKYNPITDGEIKYLFVCNTVSIFNIKC
jgi:hypothetical protein